MSQQSRQKFHRTSSRSRSRKLSKDQNIDDSLVKNSIMIQQQSQHLLSSSIKRSQQQMSIDDRYQFVINPTINKEVKYDESVNNNISHLVNKLKHFLLLRVLKSFYKIKISQSQKNLSLTKTTPYMVYIIKSIKNKHLLQSLMRIKLNVYRSKRIDTHLCGMEKLFKRKLNQNVGCTFFKLKQNVIREQKNKLAPILTKNEIQREHEFQKFQQSIQLNLKQKDYQLAKINIQNLVKKFNKQDKYIPKLTMYESTLEILTQLDKSSNVLKQSQGLFYKMTNFLDPLNINLSMTNNKQIKKQLVLVKNRLQNPRSKSRESNFSNSGSKDVSMTIENNNNNNNKKTSSQPSFFESIQKVNDMIHSLFEQLAVKSTQKTSLQLQYQNKIQTLLKQQADFKKRIHSYEQNEKLLMKITERFKQTDNLSKQLTETNRRAGKRKNQFPFTLISQLITFTNQQKKQSTQFNSAIKSLAFLYGRKNISEDTFNEQKTKIDEKYLTNQLYTNTETQINLLIKNVTEKQRHLIEGEMRKLRNDNDKLQRQLQTQRMKSSGVYSSAQSVNQQRSSRKGSVTKSEQFDFVGMEGLKEKNQALQKVIKEKQSKIRQLSQQIQAYEKATLQKDLVSQTLQNILQKIQARNDTWRRDVDVLRNGKYQQKYSLIFRVVDLIKPHVIEQNKLFNQSFQTLIYNSKKQSLMGMKKVSEELSDRVIDDSNVNNSSNSNNLLNNLSDKNNLPLLGTKISSRDNLSPQKQATPLIIDNHPRISERISWDLSSQHVNELDPKATNSFILQDNLLLDDQSDILGMKESNLLDFDNVGRGGVGQNDDYKNSNNMDYQSKRLSFPLVQERKLLLRVTNDNNNNNTTKNINNNNNTTKNNLIPQSIVSQQEMSHLNSILVKVMSEQYSIQQLRQKQLPQLLKNAYFANLVIMIESYVSMMEKLNQLVREKDQLEVELENVGQNRQLKQQQQQQQHQQQQQQLQLIQSLQRQLKENQLKYKSQLQYYQRLQQQQYRSPQKLIQRTVKSSRSVKSIKSIKSNPSSSIIQNTNNNNYNNKVQQIKSQYKQTIQQLSREQKKLLQQIQNLNIQKNNLLEIIMIKQVTIQQLKDRLNQMTNKCLQKQKQIDDNKAIQRQVKQRYQQEFVSLREDLERVKEQVYKELELKQHDVIYYKQAYQVLLRKYQQEHNIKQIQRQFKQQQFQQQQFKQQHQIKQQRQINHLNPNIINNNLNPNIINNLSNNNKRQQINMQQQILTNNTNTRLQGLQPSPSPIKHVDQNTYLVTQHSISHAGSTQTYREISQIQQLKMHIRQLQQQRNHVVESEVLKALKAQQEEFNNFYRENMIRMEEHFINEVIPQRVKQAQHILSTSVHNDQPLDSIHNINSQQLQQSFLTEKYEQWKLTYLPVILQLRQKQWRQYFEQHQLKQIIAKKYQQWQSLKLLAIMRQPQNEWIIRQLLKDNKLTEINLQQQKQQNNNLLQQQAINKIVSQNNLYWQQQINRKVREVQSYWQTVALPAAINSQLNQWNIQQEIIMKEKVQQVEVYWQSHVMPERVKEYEQKLRSLQTAMNEERLKVREQFGIQLNRQLKYHQQQYRTTMIPKLKLQWQHAYVKQQQHSITLNKQQLNIQQIITAKYEQWKQTYLKEYLRVQRQQWLQQFKRTQLEKILQQRQSQWESIKLLAIVKEKRNQWVVDVLLKQKMLEVGNNNNNNHNSNSQSRLTQQLNKQQQRLRLQSQQLIKLRVIEVQQYWQHLLETQRVNFTSTLNKSLQQRTIQIERYWQAIMLPQIKSQWESQQKNINNVKSINNNNTINSNSESRQLTITTYLQSQQFTTLLFTKHQQWLLQRQQQQKTRLSQMTTKYQQRMMQLQVEIERLRLTEREIEKYKEQIGKFRKVIDERELSIVEISNKLVQRENTIIQQQQSITRLQQQLSQQLKSTPKQQSPLVIKQSSSLSTKQAIYKLQTDYMRELNENKTFYEDRLAQVNHEKTLLNIRIKQLEGELVRVRSSVNANVSANRQLEKQQPQSNQTSNTTTNNTVTTTNNNITLTTIQSNYQKQLLSLQATIKNKQAQLAFIKKSLQSLTLQNQQLINRLSITNNKLSNIQNTYEELSNKSLKVQYELKYSREKQSQFGKKLEAQLVEFNQYRARLQLEKNILEKRVKELTVINNQYSMLQLRVNQLQSQKVITQANIKNLQYDIQRKRKSYEQLNQQLATKQRTLQSLQSTQIQSKATIKQLQLSIKNYQTIIKQHELVITQLKVENKHYHEEINRLNVHLQSVSNNGNNSNTNSRNRQQHNSYQHNNYQHYNNNAQLQSLIIQIQRLKLQNYRLKQKLLQLQSQQTTHIHHLKSHIQQLQQKLYTANLYHHEGEITQIQILKKINSQISQLVSNNKQLQLRIIVLENQKELSAFGISIQRFFVAFQQQMDNLVNYLIGNMLFYSQMTLSEYNKFQQKSREALSHGYVEDYFRQWQAFMRAVIEENIQRVKKSANLQRQQQQSSIYRQQHHHQSTTTNKQQQLSQQHQQQQDELDNIIQKYDTVLNDVKFTLTQFIKTGDSQLLSLMARSLGVDYQHVQGEIVINGHNGRQEVYSSNSNNERTLVRQ